MCSRQRGQVGPARESDNARLYLLCCTGRSDARKRPPANNVDRRTEPLVYPCWGVGFGGRGLRAPRGAGGRDARHAWYAQGVFPRDLPMVPPTNPLETYRPSSARRPGAASPPRHRPLRSLIPHTQSRVLPGHRTKVTRGQAGPWQAPLQNRPAPECADGMPSGTLDQTCPRAAWKDTRPCGKGARHRKANPACRATGRMLEAGVETGHGGTRRNGAFCPTQWLTRAARDEGRGRGDGPVPRRAPLSVRDRPRVSL